MALEWVREPDGIWDEDKARIIGGAPAGAFDRRYGDSALGDRVPGEWWHVEDGGKTVGYGWMDIVWGEAEILLATASDAEGRGVGTFALEHLGREAKNRGVNYVYNTVRPSHPDAPRVTAWLEKRGFKGSEDSSLRAPTKA